MKRIKELGPVVLLMLAMMSPVIVCGTLSYFGGSAEHFSSMGFVGPMTCEWKSDGYAVMTNARGTQRLYKIDRQEIAVGKTYELRRGPGTRWHAGRPYLTETKS